MSEPVEIGPPPEQLADADTGEHRPITAFDVSDENPAVLANHMRAIQREMHAGFELLAQKLLTSFERINEKLDDIIDWKNEVTRWQASATSRMADLERWQSQTDARLASLERKKRPTRRGGKGK